MTTTLYQAGAGSGKTYTITRDIIQRLAEGKAEPGRILATTFTRKAAAELKDRIQTRLLRPEEDDPKLPLEQRLELASAMGEATIGTVHSVGHQLLSRYAMRLGMSPNLEPIEEKAQERHLRNIIAEMPREGWETLDGYARRLGIENQQDLVLGILNEKRSNAIPDDVFQESMRNGTERLIEIISGGNSEPLADFDAFYDACKDALQRAEANGDETKGSKAARQELADLIRAKRQAWSVWGQAATLKWTKTSEATVQDLTSLARRANVHGALHEDLRAITEAFIDQTLQLQRYYQAYKEAHGLVDFTDLEERFLHLVTDSAIREDLARGLDLVVVDEFQDTNPIQLAIFQELANLGKESLWVGDDKQAIYGFRGTDPQLMRDVMDTIPEDQHQTLERNWRSQEGLVKAVNNIFTPIFGEGTPLEAQHHGASHIARWSMSDRRREDRQAAFVARVAQLAEDKAAGDIAILVRKNADALDLSAGLAAHGVPSLVQIPGLLSTREGAMLHAALRFVADRRDKLAAATLLQIEDQAQTPAWFIDAIQNPEAKFQGDQLDALDGLDARTLSPSSVIASAIQALELPDRIAAWGDPMRRAANLDELILLGQRYEDEMEQEGKAATLTGLVYWLDALQSSDEDLLPTPAGVDAVRIMTLWKAKGLEWPTVILYQDGAAPLPMPFRTRVSGGNASQGKPLDGRSIEHWCYPFGYSYRGGMNRDGSGIQKAAKESQEGVALEQAHRDEVKRLLYVGFTRAKDTLILAEGGSKNSLQELPDLDEVLPPDGSDPGLGCSYEVEVLAAEEHESESRLESATWMEAARGKQEHVRRYWSPSSQESIATSTLPEALPGDHPFPDSIHTEDWTNLGQAVHAYLAAIPALRNASDEERIEHAEACLTRWGRGGDVEAKSLVAAGKRLEAWANTNLDEWSVEVPTAVPREGGGQWTGIIDLLIQADDGGTVVDHKSADFREDGWKDKAASYAGQLEVYRAAVQAKRCLIHFPTGGGMVEVERMAEETNSHDAKPNPEGTAP